MYVRLLPDSARRAAECLSASASQPAARRLGFWRGVAVWHARATVAPVGRCTRRRRPPRCSVSTCVSCPGSFPGSFPAPSPATASLSCELTAEREESGGRRRGTSSACGRWGRQVARCAVTTVAPHGRRRRWALPRCTPCISKTSKRGMQRALAGCCCAPSTAVSSGRRCVPPPPPPLPRNVLRCQISDVIHNTPTHRLD